MHDTIPRARLSQRCTHRFCLSPSGPPLVLLTIVNRNYWQLCQVRIDSSADSFSAFLRQGDRYPAAQSRLIPLHPFLSIPPAACAHRYRRLPSFDPIATPAQRSPPLRPCVAIHLETSRSDPSHSTPNRNESAPDRNLPFLTTYYPLWRAP